MTKPRRAASAPIDVTLEPAAAPRHGSGGSVVLKRALAPTAVAGLLVATSLIAFTPFGSGSTSVADPLHQSDVNLGVSRSTARSPLAVPTGAPVPTVKASPGAEPSVTTPAATTSAPSAPAPSAAVTPTAKPSAAAPTPTVPAKLVSLGEEVDARYTATALNVRKGPGTDFDVIVSLSDGKEVVITDKTFQGWQQINLKGKAGWVKSSYLTDDAPVAPDQPVGSTKSGNSSAVAGPAITTSEQSSLAATDDTSTCAKVERIVGGLTSRTARVARAVCNQFPQVSSYGGRRPGDSGYHGSGQAVDVMVSSQYGWQIAKWARANAASMGIIEVIYSKQIWTKQRSGDGWRPMSDRGGVTANHLDHVHITVG